MFQFTPHLGLESLLPILLYSGAIIACLLSLLKNPRIGLYYLIPILPLQTVRYRLHEYPFGALLVDIVLLCVVIGMHRQGYAPLRDTGLGKLLVVFIVFTYIALWKGTFYLDADLPLWFDNVRLQDWKNYMVMPLLFFVVSAAFRDTKQIRMLILLMCLSVVLLNKYYMGTVSARDFSQFSYDVRYAGAMGYAGVNGFAAFEAQFCTFLLGLYCFERRILARAGYLALLAFSLYCLLFALSRGGYASVLLGFFYVGVFRKRSLLIVLFAFLLSWQTLVPPAVRERVFMTKTADGEMDHSAGDRLQLWEDAVALFKSDPVFGAGFNTYAYMRRLGYGDTHNLYLKVLVELGVVGFCIFAFLLLRMLGSGLRLWRKAEDPFLQSLGFAFAGLMLCAVVANMFGDRWTFLQVSGYTWALAGLVSSGLRIVREQSSAEMRDDVDDQHHPVMTVPVAT